VVFQIYIYIYTHICVFCICKKRILKKSNGTLDFIPVPPVLPSFLSLLYMTCRPQPSAALFIFFIARRTLCLSNRDCHLLHSLAIPPHRIPVPSPDVVGAPSSCRPWTVPSYFSLHSHHLFPLHWSDCHQWSPLMLTQQPASLASSPWLRVCIVERHQNGSQSTRDN
jgi:hypothetical protein